MSSPQSPNSDFPNGSSPPPDSNINHAHSIAYWSEVPATVNGMLGGFREVSRIDLKGSKAFIAKTRQLISASLPLAPEGHGLHSKLPRGVDCGAGIGRVTEGVLREVCDVVDAVEPVEKFARVLQRGRCKPGAVRGEVHVLGLENWIPRHEYDLIWVQWCAGHLTDEQLVGFIERCRKSLTETGFMVVKENTTIEMAGDEYDEEDSCVTRTHEKYLALFKAAGMQVVMTDLQSGFPKRLRLLPVRFYALRPVD